MSKRTARKQAAGPTYYAVLFDDEGQRRVCEGYSSPAAVARHLAGVVAWGMNVAEFASSWNATSPTGSQRFGIGQDD